jgi:hypothetical protein
MILQYITFGNGIIIYEYYNYYVIAHSICTGFYIIYKIFETGKSINNYFFTSNNIKSIDYKDNIIDEWVII